MKICPCRAIMALLPLILLPVWMNVIEEVEEEEDKAEQNQGPPAVATLGLNRDIHKTREIHALVTNALTMFKPLGKVHRSFFPIGPKRIHYVKHHGAPQAGGESSRLKRRSSSRWLGIEYSNNIRRILSKRTSPQNPKDDHEPATTGRHERDVLKLIHKEIDPVSEHAHVVLVGSLSTPSTESNTFDSLSTPSTESNTFDSLSTPSSESYTFDSLSTPSTESNTFDSLSTPSTESNTFDSLSTPSTESNTFDSLSTPSTESNTFDSLSTPSTESNTFDSLSTPSTESNTFDSLSTPSTESNTFDSNSDRENLADTDSSSYYYDMNSVEYSRHGDDFMCPPCRCSRVNKGNTVANCTFRNQTVFPVSLPNTSYAILNFTGNYLTFFNICSVAAYRSVNTLDLSRNQIKTIFSHSSNEFTSDVEILIINDNKINVIDRNSFKPMINLRELEIRCNQLAVINETTFRYLKKLTYLDLSGNRIQTIHDDCFDSLVNLKCLLLNHNKLLYKRINQLKMARYLPKLTKLHIQGNLVSNAKYPNELLGKLENLKELFIDMLGKGVEFGRELSNLKHLKTLRFVCVSKNRIKNVSSTFFQNVPNIESLTLQDCKIHDIDPRAFFYIPKLTTYKLDQLVLYDLSRAFEGLKGLQNSSLTSVTFVDLQHHPSPVCRYLTVEQGKYIRNLSLEVLDLTRNRLAMLGKDFLTCLPKTLNKLILAQNKFSISQNPFAPELVNLTMLTFLDLTDQNKDYKYLKKNAYCYEYHHLQRSRYNLYNQYNIPALGNNSRRRMISQKQQDKKTMTISDKPVESNTEALSQTDILLNTELENDYVDSKHYTYSSMKYTQPPPMLRTLIASGYMSFGSVFLSHKIKKPYMLSNLYFASNYMTDCGQGHLPSTIKVLDLSNNQCKMLSRNFFPKQNNLFHLNLQNNNLGMLFSEDYNGSLLQHLNELAFLDISVNSIFSLPKNFFKGLYNLQTIILRENKLQVFKVSISHLAVLTYIDVSKNSISWVEDSVRRDLDRIASHDALRLVLTENPLHCTCHGSDMLQWLAHTKVILLSKEYIQCYNDKGEIEYIGDFGAKVNQLKSQCTSYTAFIAGGAAGGGGFILSLVLTIVIYKKRWHIMYSINNGLLAKLWGFKPRSGNTTSMKFDAFVVYDEEDRDFVLVNVLRELETKRSHKLCVEDRDFIPGTLNFNNIINAVQNSTVTLFIISPNFIGTRDFDFPIHMALLEEYSQNNRQLCTLLLYKPTPVQAMPKELQMLLRNGRFLEYPQDDNSRQDSRQDDLHDRFWDRLSNELGHSRQRVLADDETEPLIS